MHDIFETIMCFGGIRAFTLLFSALISSLTIFAQDVKNDADEVGALRDILLAKDASGNYINLNACPEADYAADFEIIAECFFCMDDREIFMRRLKANRESLELYILQRLEAERSFELVYLSTFLEYESALPVIRERLLQCSGIYKWEGPNYYLLESYLLDDQYVYQRIYIRAIEYIAKQDIRAAIALTETEYPILFEKYAKVFPVDRKIVDDSSPGFDWNDFDAACSAWWLLDKLGHALPVYAVGHAQP